MEDAIKRKGRPLPGTSTHIQLSELPIPLPLSRFQWPLVSAMCLYIFFYARYSTMVATLPTVTRGKVIFQG